MAERHILQGLKEGGWLKGEIEEMLEQRVAALFMPHGESSELIITKSDMITGDLPALLTE